MLLADQVELLRENLALLRRQEFVLPLMGGLSATRHTYRFKSLIHPARDIATAIAKADPVGNKLPNHLRGWNINVTDEYRKTRSIHLKKLLGMVIHVYYLRVGDGDVDISNDRGARFIVPYDLFLDSVVAWIEAEMEFALSQAVASGNTFEHGTSECGHCVQDFLAGLDLRDLPGEAAGSESGADDALPPADLRFYPAALIVPCGHLPGHAAVAADLGNMAIPNGWIPRRLRSDHCVLWRRYNHIQGLPIPFPPQIPCGRSIIGAVRQKARDRGIELIQEPG